VYSPFKKVATFKGGNTDHGREQYVKIMFRPKPTSPDTPKVLALLREHIERALCNTGVTAQDVRALLRSDDWCALHSRNGKLLFFYEFVKTEYSRSLTSEALGQAFAIEPSHVRKIHSKAEKKPKPPYRLAALNEVKQLQS
jgi:hypothetical protein